MPPSSASPFHSSRQSIWGMYDGRVDHTWVERGPVAVTVAVVLAGFAPGVFPLMPWRMAAICPTMEMWHNLAVLKTIASKLWWLAMTTFLCSRMQAGGSALIIYILIILSIIWLNTYLLFFLRKLRSTNGPSNHQNKKAEFSSEKLNYRVNFFTYSPLETSLILADKGSPFGLDDNKLSIKLQTATQINLQVLYQYRYQLTVMDE